MSRRLPTDLPSRAKLPGTAAGIEAHVEWRTADRSINQTLGCYHAAISCFKLTVAFVLIILLGTSSQSFLEHQPINRRS
jgi:hypothetical protein